MKKENNTKKKIKEVRIYIGNGETQSWEDYKKEHDAWMNKPFNKYFWLPLHRKFLYPFIFNPLSWLRMLPHNIKFRIKHKCPYKDTWSLDHTFYRWVYPRTKYTIQWMLKNYVLDKETKRDYRRMLKLLEMLKDCDFDCLITEKETETNDEFLQLWTKHLLGLGT